MKISFTAAAALLAAASSLHAQFWKSVTLQLTAQPATATIYKVKAQDNSLIALGVGQAQLKLDKGDQNMIVVRQEGYRDIKKSFPFDGDYKDKSFTLFLDTRVTMISALPYDADIYVNGEVRGQRALELEIPEGQPTTVELKKTGFATVKRIYRWEKGGTELPPVKDRLELEDRQVSVSAAPSGSEIFADEQKLGTNDANVVVKRGTCANVKVTRANWMVAERTYCNKEGMPPTPVNDRIVLAGRVVDLRAPDGAKIFVNHKQAGVGAYSVQVKEGSCVAVRVEQPSFLPFDKEYCVQPNSPEPPPEEIVKLAPDDSYAASVASDQANVNVTVEVGAGKTEEAAWKLVSSIVLQAFDVLENSDRETGYLRTAWQIKSWNNNAVVVRTRIIVKRASDSPLRYTVKIVSERNKYAGVSVKEDENFEPWDRLLNTYKDVMSEMQSRLK